MFVIFLRILHSSLWFLRETALRNNVWRFECYRLDISGGGGKDTPMSPSELWKVLPSLQAAAHPLGCTFPMWKCWLTSSVKQHSSVWFPLPPLGMHVIPCCGASCFVCAADERTFSWILALENRHFQCLAWRFPLPPVGDPTLPPVITWWRHDRNTPKKKST